MPKYTKEDILRLVEENHIHFICLKFTDLYGMPKSVEVHADQLEKALDGHFSFDGSCIHGFSRLEESDMYLKPDLENATVDCDTECGVLRLICDIYDREGKPFIGDPRGILKRVIGDMEKAGFSAEVGPKCEFFLFQTDEYGSPTNQTMDKGEYFDVAPLDMGEECRREICTRLEELGIAVEASHHEMSKGQHEIIFRYDDALSIADKMMIFKSVAKSTAEEFGLYATFMPKPIQHSNGSGMRFGMTLNQNGTNAFYDSRDKNYLSEVAYHFMAGIMAHIKGLTAITNPLVNSYKRLVPGYVAPNYIVWSGKNLSPLLRVPAPENEVTQIELCSSDAAANPYLALAVTLAAGLDGVLNKMIPSGSVDINIAALTPEERKKAGIESLPENLKEALAYLKGEPIVWNVLGKETTECYLTGKTREWEEYRKEVSEWELRRYLSRY